MLLCNTFWGFWVEISLETGAIEVHAFIALTLGIVVYFLGERLTSQFSILRTYSIPEPVSGGLLAALLFLGVVILTGRECPSSEFLGQMAA